MAARRVTKSAVDWAAFAERVPPAQKDIFRSFKAKSDGFVSRVHKFPENLPQIDWSVYKSRIAMPGLVDKFEKAYGGVTVPYPADKANTKATIDGQEKEAAVKTQQEIAAVSKVIADAKALVQKIDSVPPIEEMTHEMYAAYFPDLARTAAPSFFPHTKSYQPENDKETLH